MKKSTVFILSLLAVQPAYADQNLVTVSAEEIANAKLKGSFKNDLFRLTGVLPSACADRLSMTDINVVDPEKTMDSAEGQEVSKDSLHDYATKVTFNVSFKSDAEHATLKDCLTKYENGAERKNVDLSHLMPGTAKLAIVTVGEEGTEWKSPELIRLEKQHTNLECTSCNSSWSKARSTLKDARGFDSPLLEGLMSKLLENSLKEADSSIDEASQLVGLEKISKELFEMLDFAKAETLQLKIVDLLEKSVLKSLSLSKSGHITASMASRHADFAHDTYMAIAKIKIIESDANKKSDFKQRATEFAKGSDSRIQYISSIDGDNPEVRAYLKIADAKQRDFLFEMNRVCNTFHPQAFAQCAEMRVVFQQNEKILLDLQNRYVSSYNQVWNNVYSQWDFTNKQGDQRWKSTYQINSPSMIMKSGNSIQTPTSVQYTGMDRSGTQQQLNAMSGLNSNQFQNYFFPVK
jgi:hypothetical protein